VPWRGPFIRAKAVGIDWRFTGVFAAPAVQISLRRRLAGHQRHPKQGNSGDPAMMLHLPLRAARARREVRRRPHFDLGRSPRRSTKFNKAARASIGARGPVKETPEWRGEL